MKAMTKKMNPLYTNIVTDYLNSKSLDLDCAGLIVNSKEYSCFPGQKFSKDEVLDILNLNKDLVNKKLILNCDRIIHEPELEELRKYLNLFIDKVDYIIYSDYAVLSLIDKKYLDKLIYDPKTLVCSYNELNELDTKAFISSEISTDELSEFIYHSEENKLCINAFGYHQIMYSKRPLISLYNSHINNVYKNNVYSNISKLEKNTVYDLKEELREDLYKIIENEQGTFIYTHFIYALLENLNIIKEKVFMFRINSFLLEDDEIKFILTKYKDLINTKDLDEQKDLINEIESKFPKAKPGFLKDELYLIKNKSQ